VYNRGLQDGPFETPLECHVKGRPGRSLHIPGIRGW